MDFLNENILTKTNDDIYFVINGKTNTLKKLWKLNCLYKVLKHQLKWKSQKI